MGGARVGAQLGAPEPGPRDSVLRPPGSDGREDSDGHQDRRVPAAEVSALDVSTWPDATSVEEGLHYVVSLAEHLASWFDEVLPPMLRLLAHPGIRESLHARHADLHAALLDPVTMQLARLADRGMLASGPEQAARLLLTLAHDASITSVLLAGEPPGSRNPGADGAARLERTRSRGRRLLVNGTKGLLGWSRDRQERGWQSTEPPACPWCVRRVRGPRLPAPTSE